MNVSLFDLFSPEASTSWIIFDAVDSPKVLSTLIFSAPEMLMQPEMTSLPTPTSRGMLSPVSATVLRLERPPMTVPSIGIFSPGFTTTVSPTCTEAGLTTVTWPLRSTLAVSGRMSIISEMDLRLLSSA